MKILISISVLVKCLVAKGLYCSDMDPQTRQFNRTIENGCQFTSNQKNFSTALLLSVFFGWLGLDRFYLGYYAIGNCFRASHLTILGLLKLFSFGFFFILYLLDIVLITLQLLGPADGSGYSMPYYGPKSYNVHGGNESSMAFYGCFDCLFVIP